jgi:hypothetical protein
MPYITSNPYSVYGAYYRSIYGVNVPLSYVNPIYVPNKTKKLKGYQKNKK